MENITLYYIYDPMCSWCWGYRPVWDEIQKLLPTNITIEYVAGGLAPDSKKTMPNEQQLAIQQHWRTIEKRLGTEFNFDFWLQNTPRRSTYDACRTVIAASYQAQHIQMIDAIQRAYYLRAMNPSDESVLYKVAKEVAEQSNGEFSYEKFVEDFTSDELERELTKQIEQARTLSSQGFPSLVLSVKNKMIQIPVDYLNATATCQLIERVSES
ncbi:DsbA family protein [Colwellia sp. RSH04]|uniref:DsbA family protein n=1 Tax=Colwellia sp. RSH04 TaxID=2305464 RepID=UPI000E58470E|nr:DsbA family protein [Colwellia sp. RSH04]RHW74658.1 DsbA family protein [Colwellia sp. RSH04]